MLIDRSQINKLFSQARMLMKGKKLKVGFTETSNFKHDKKINSIYENVRLNTSRDNRFISFNNPKSNVEMIKEIFINNVERIEIHSGVITMFVHISFTKLDNSKSLYRQSNNVFYKVMIDYRDKN